MSRNTKEVSLIQHRSGNLAEMPKALHQAELGLAKDANRLFIGNAVNTILANRTEFPYQNLEILTEYSDLRDHFRYSYENNINIFDTTTSKPVDRAKLKEFLPIVITCEKSIGEGLLVGGTITINGQNVVLRTSDTVYQVVEKINAVSNQTNTYVTVLQTSIANEITGGVLTFVCLDSELVVTDYDNSGILTTLGFPVEVTYDISMPERKVTEKLDDTLHITDFGIKGDNSNSSQKIYNALVEVYRNYEDTQFYRDVMFPAGTYLYEPQEVETSSTISTFSPFPLISNLHVHGEGIDRTVIKASTAITDGNYVLVNGVDNQLNPGTSTNYGVNSYPTNILVEDVTFDSGLKNLCIIDGITNITFNRVKFKGSSTTTLITIVGKGTQYASNITFNECIFEGGNIGILADKFAENITVTNCLFDSLTTNAVKLGDDNTSMDAPVKAVNMNGNIIKATPVGLDTSSYAITVGRNAKYISIHQTQFEDRLFTNWRSNRLPKPYYISNQNTSAYNFIDTLDPTTDEQKVLRFKFAQPQWEYLDYLVNQEGNKIVVVDKSDNEVTAPNGLHISESASEVDIRAVGTDAGNLKISLENSSDLVLGSGTDSTSSVSGNIQIRKKLQLNDNHISNETGNNDIIISTADDKVIKVDETGNTPYESLIRNEPNALVNVNFVKRQIIDTYEKIVTYKDLENTENGELPLITFNPDIYGNSIHLKRITINVRSPFYKTFEYISKATLYTTGMTYFDGDVVRGTVNGEQTYAVVINTHEATGDNIASNDNLQIIPNQPTYENVKFVNVIETIPNSPDSILTQVYSEDFSNTTSPKLEYVDIQKNNRFGYISCEEFKPGESYSSETGDKLVSYCDRNYVLLNLETPTTFNAVDLHDSDKAARKYDEGYCYTFEMDRNFNMTDMGQANPSSVDYSGKTLKLAFYDKDQVKFNSFDTPTRLCPGGKLIVRIEFFREEVE